MDRKSEQRAITIIEEILMECIPHLHDKVMGAAGTICNGSIFRINMILICKLTGMIPLDLRVSSKMIR